MDKPELLKLCDKDLREQVEYTGILATRVREIRGRGYRYAVVETGDMSKPIVQKHGFEYLTTVWDYELKDKNEN